MCRWKMAEISTTESRIKNNLINKSKAVKVKNGKIVYQIELHYTNLVFSLCIVSMLNSLSINEIKSS